MRNRFDTQLELLNTELIEMGALCENAIACAAKALIENDKDSINQAIQLEKEIDQKEREIEDLCLNLLLRQQPVARDLRLISAALKMITDMERVGDQAADISEIVTLANIGSSVNTVHIADMSAATIKMMTDSIDAFVRRDLELSREVIAYDDVVDNLFNKIKKELISLVSKDIKNSEAVIDLLMIAKYFERIGDHAVNIAEWVEYSITGKHKWEVYSE
ncbi:MAG: phosphate signaling complex protein PhoU [Eubacteriales bacterium]